MRIFIPIVLICLFAVFSCKSIAKGDVPAVSEKETSQTQRQNDLAIDYQPEYTFEDELLSQVLPEEEQKTDGVLIYDEEFPESNELADYFVFPDLLEENKPYETKEFLLPFEPEYLLQPDLLSRQTELPRQAEPRVESPVQSQVPVQSQPQAQSQSSQQRTPSREPPVPPSFIRPAEPESSSPQREVPAVPGQINPLPEKTRAELSESAGEQVVFSRVVRLMVGQLLEIPFRGTGWVYLGELGSRRGLSYDSRRLDIERAVTVGQSFIFRADAAGTYILKFYRQDFIQDYIINDYVQVIVENYENPGTGRPGYYIDRGRIVAEPRWPPAGGPSAGQGPVSSGVQSASASAQTPAAAQSPGQETPAAALSAEQTLSASAPVASAAAASPVERSETTGRAEGTMPAGRADEAAPATAFLPEDFVRQAKQEFDAGRVEQALAVLDLMKQRYPLGTDEALWLYAQLLEANSPRRDIRLALEYYRLLVSEYPQSNRVSDARTRIAYLERFYFNIR